jgi:replicative DNA helicase
MSAARDEADRMRDGDLPEDPEAETRVVSAKVPRVLTVDEILNASAVRALAARQRDFACTTGHYKIDRITGGLRPGYTWLFGADTSYGKSSWCIAVADDNLRAGKRVLIVSSEDTEEVYGDRLMVRRAKVDALRYRDQQLNQDERDRVAEVVQRAESVPVYVDARRWPIEDLAPHLAKIIREDKIDVVVFDYIQEFRSKRKWPDERVKFREIASMCRHVVKDAKISGILCSQLTMPDDTKIPTRANIRECRDIANAAEVILIGFEPTKALETKTGTIEPGTKCVFVDKVKNGPRGAKIAMSWNSESACFESESDPELDRYSEFDDIADNYDDRRAP